jgi:hypothetical protein
MRRAFGRGAASRTAVSAVFFIDSTLFADSAFAASATALAASISAFASSATCFALSVAAFLTVSWVAPGCAAAVPAASATRLAALLRGSSVFSWLPALAAAASFT